MSALPDSPWTATARTLFRWIPFLGDAECKVVFALYELTYGEGKPQGVRLHYAALEAATGLKERGLRNAIKTLSECGAIAYKPGKSTRDPGAFKVLIGWKPVAYADRIPARNAGIENEAENGNSHLNTGTKSGDVDTGTKSGDIPARKAVVLNTKSKTKSKTFSPLASFDPQGGSVVRFKPPTCDEVKAYFIELGGTAADAEEYFDWQLSVNWKPRSGPVKDWRASVRNAHRRNIERRAQAQPRGSPTRNGSAPPGGMTADERAARTRAWLGD